MINPDDAISGTLPNGVRYVATVRQPTDRLRDYEVQSKAFVRGLDSRPDVVARREALPPATPKGDNPENDRAYTVFNRWYAHEAKDLLLPIVTNLRDLGLVLCTTRYMRSETTDPELVFRQAPNGSGSYILLGGHLYQRPEPEYTGRYVGRGPKRDLWVLLPAGSP